MFTDSSESSTSSFLWWTPSTWVPDPTQDPSSTLPTTFSDLSLTSTGDSWTWSWTDLDPTLTAAEPSSTSTLALSSPPLTSIVMVSSTPSLSGPIETQISPADSTRQSSNSKPVRLKTGHIVAICIVAFVVLLAIGALFLYLLFFFRRRRSNHHRLYTDPDETRYDDSATKTSLNKFDAAVHSRGRGDSFGELMPSRRMLDRSYYNGRRSLSDGGATSTTPLLRPSLGQSDSPGSEQENLALGWGVGNIHESPMVESAGLDQKIAGLSSRPSPPRYSRALPTPPILRPPRPLPKPKNPRPLVPQRRSNSIQVRMQTKPPLISNSTTSLPLSSSPPVSSFSSSPLSSPSSSSSSPSSSPPGLCNIKSSLTSVSEKPLPLRPQRRTENPSSSSMSVLNSPVTPFRPTPSVSFKDIQHPNATHKPKTQKPKNMKLRRNQPHTRKRSGQSGSLSLTSESSFRCAGEGTINQERDFFTSDSVVVGESSSPSAYSQLSAERGTSIDFL